MKYNQIRLIGNQAVTLHIDGASVNDQFILKDASGLGPSEIDVFMGNTLYQGGFYQGRRPLTKQVIIKIGLNPDYSDNQTAEELREMLYSLLSPSQPENAVIQLRNNSTVVAQLNAYASKFEIVPFSRVPEVQVTFESSDIYWNAPEPINMAASSAELVEFNNPGSARSGFNMLMRFPTFTYLPGLTITDTATGKHFEILITDGPAELPADSRIRINTIEGSREASLLVDGYPYISLLKYITDESDWLEVTPGESTFVIDTEYFVWDEFIYTPRWWGV